MDFGSCRYRCENRFGALWIRINWNRVFFCAACTGSVHRWLCMSFFALACGVAACGSFVGPTLRPSADAIFSRENRLQPPRGSNWGRVRWLYANCRVSRDCSSGVRASKNCHYHSTLAHVILPLTWFPSVLRLADCVASDVGYSCALLPWGLKCFAFQNAQSYTHSKYHFYGSGARFLNRCFLKKLHENQAQQWPGRRRWESLPEWQRQ